MQMLVKNLCSVHPVGVDYESETILEVLGVLRADVRMHSPFYRTV